VAVVARDVDSPNPPADPHAATAATARPVRRWLYVLLVAPFVGTLWVPTYAHDGPRLFGVPFFYWYQFAWVIASAALTAAVYLATTSRRHGGPPRPGAAVPPPAPVPTGRRGERR
jgi:hypothetical protein